MSKIYKAAILEVQKKETKKPKKLNEVITQKLDAVVNPIAKLVEENSLVSRFVDPKIREKELIERSKKYTEWSKESLISELAKLELLLDLQNAFSDKNHITLKHLSSALFSSIQHDIQTNKNKQGGKTVKFAPHLARQALAKSILAKMQKESGTLGRDDAKRFYSLMRAECSKNDLKLPSHNTLANYYKSFYKT